jgi:hypothetical protein
VFQQEEDVIDKIIEFDDENGTLAKQTLSLGDHENIYKVRYRLARSTVCPLASIFFQYLSQTETHSESEYSDADMNTDSENEGQYNSRRIRGMNNNANKPPGIVIKQEPQKTPTDSLSSARYSQSTSRSSNSDNQLTTQKKRLKQDSFELNNSNSNKENEISSKYATNLKRKAIINQSLLIDKSIKINSKLRLNRNNSHDTSNMASNHYRMNKIQDHSSLDRSTAARASQAFDFIMKNNNNSEKTESRIAQNEMFNSSSFLSAKQQAGAENPEYEEIYNQKLSTAVYKMLQQLEIKFPGKNPQQARAFLSEVSPTFSFEHASSEVDLCLDLFQV